MKIEELNNPLDKLKEALPDMERDHLLNFQDIAFEVTEDHIKLVTSSNIKHFEHPEGYFHGSAQVDIKRPYGNSDILESIATVIGMEHPEWDDDNDEVGYGKEYELELIEWEDANKSHLLSLHEDIATVLNIILCTKSFDVGYYIGDWFARNWKRSTKEEAAIVFALMKDKQTIEDKRKKAFECLDMIVSVENAEKDLDIKRDKFCSLISEL